MMGDKIPVFDAPAKNHALMMVRRLLLAAIDVGCLAAVVGLHKIVEALASWAIPPDWEKLKTVLTVVFAGAFSLVYIHLVLDMVMIFLPWLRGKPKTPPVVNTTTMVKGKAK
jgi:uncharacterized metal-binding protein